MYGEQAWEYFPRSYALPDQAEAWRRYVVSQGPQPGGQPGRQWVLKTQQHNQASA